MRKIRNALILATKEVRGLIHDWVLLALVAWSFTLGLYTEATGVGHELNNAAVGIIDEDGSTLSRRIADALLPPHFAPPVHVGFAEADTALDRGELTFVLDIPQGFQSDLLSGRRPTIQVALDATAVMQAGLGSGYVARIVAIEVERWLRTHSAGQSGEIALAARIAYNQNLDATWFTSITSVIGHVTTLAVVLGGAAFVRERERGTLEHLLAMPLRPFEIVLAKVLAAGSIILVAALIAIIFIVQGLLKVPVAGSIPLYVGVTALYLVFATSLGIFLGTVARTMPRFGLLFILVVLPMQLLSGGETPVESIPTPVRILMQGLASTHYMSMSKAILFRGAGLEVIWPQLLATVALAAALFAFALARFRRSVAPG